LSAETKGLSAELYRAIVAVVDERLKDIRVTRESFDALRDAVRELAKAQAKTEERVGRLEAAVERLAEAQARTEERVGRLEAAVERLAKAQAKTEERVGRLEAAVERLAKAQAKTEERVGRLEAAVERLAKAQAKTEQRVEELAKAQAKTEERLEELAKAQARTEEALHGLARQVGALADTIGFGLEDIAHVVLPGYLERHYGLKLEGPLGAELGRKFFDVEGQFVEINLYGEGLRDGQRVTLLGEAKSRIYGREVERFAREVEMVRPLIKGEVMRVMFGYYLHPTAEEEAKKHGIILVASYQR